MRWDSKLLNWVWRVEARNIAKKPNPEIDANSVRILSQTASEKYSLCVIIRLPMEDKIPLRKIPWSG
jgi:hypothetical protein